MKKIIILLFSFIALYAQDAFVSAEYLRNSFDDKNLVVIDISDSYKMSHIDGAISFDVHYLIDKEKSNNALKSPRRIQEIFGNIGLSDDSHVIIYGRNDFEDFKRATFLAFVLISSGFEEVRILDGGYMSWIFEYDSLVTKEVRILDSHKITLKPKKISIDNKILKNISKRNLLLDARDSESYVNGHIQGAKNSPYRDKFLRDYTLISSEKLQDYYLRKLQISLNDIIVYSDDIFTSSLEWFIVNRVMGFRSAKIYYNSFTDYKDLGLKISSYKQ